jgi:bifunctional DNA-binding transcriptional regulator/antitoxin component of YhaV-PrlF toxin-antitoxin module
MIKMFEFGKRRIRAMNYTRQISLPKDWLRFKGIDAGNEVTIELTESGDLLIKPVKEEKETL